MFVQNSNFRVTGIPQVTALKFRDGLNMGVGTSTGQILLYDLRSNRPTRVKDHRYGLPIKSVDFHHLNHDLVASMDARIVRLWDRNTVEPLTKFFFSSANESILIIM